MAQAGDDFGVVSFLLLWQTLPCPSLTQPSSHNGPWKLLVCAGVIWECSCHTRHVSLAPEDAQTVPCPSVAPTVPGECRTRNAFAQKQETFFFFEY